MTKQPRFPHLAALADWLFEQSISSNYLTLAVFCIFAGAFVVYSESNLPEVVRHLVMVATMIGIARLFNSTPLRWAWATLVATMSLVLMLDVAVILIQLQAPA